jgi:YYY domain-containing protein
LRLYGIDWDDGRLFHPDERHILMTANNIVLPLPPDWGLLLTPQSPLNPHFFAYGSFPFYMVKLASHFLAVLGGWVGFLSALRSYNDFDHLRIIGRVLSTLFDTGTIVIVFLVGRRLWGRWVGLLGAAFVAFAVLHIQLAHFFAFDTIVTFWMMATTLAALRLADRPTTSRAIIAGIFGGLALATKISSAPVLATIGIALIVILLPNRHGVLGWKPPAFNLINRSINLAIVATLSVGITFLIAQPYTLFDLSTFLRNLAEQNAMVQGTADLPYTRQYANTTPYLYQLQNLLTWGLGWPLGFAAYGGTLYVLWNNLYRRRAAVIVVLGWVIPYFFLTGAFHAKFMRYMLPVVPVLCLFAACGLLALWRSRSVLARPLAVLAIVTVLTGSIFFSLAFTNIYSVEHTGIQASRWLYQNAPDGARIAREHWEEGLPVYVREDGRQITSETKRFQIIELRLYENDDTRKLDHIWQSITSADYIVFYSQRLYGTIPRLPHRYPLTTRFYQLLFGQELGFELAASFTSYPRLDGVTLVDDTLSDPGLPVPPLLSGWQQTPVVLNGGRADESLTVYDHPKVLVFRKNRALPKAEFDALLGSSLPFKPISRPTGLMLEPGRWAEMMAGGTYRDLFGPSGLAVKWPWLVWVVMIEVVGLVAFPIAYVAFRFLPDRGYAVSKTLGILILSWGVWLLASVGISPATRTTILIVLLALVILGMIILWRHTTGLRRFWWRHSRVIVAAEAVFWLAFLVFLAIRGLNPDLWHPFRGGEKPMDMAYLMAVVKSTWYPPYDPWFAGGYLNYYYFGQVIVATLIKLSGVVPTVAYNLAVPTLFALTASGAFSAAYNLGYRRRITWGQAAQGGLFAAVFTVCIGNLATIAQLLDQLWRNAGSIEIRSTIPGVEGLARTVAGLIATVLLGRGFPIPTDWYWTSSRVYTGAAVVNEFPLFTFLFADLHAHLIGLPFTLLALAVAINLLKSKLKSKPTRKADSVGYVPFLARLSSFVSVPGLGKMAVAGLALGALAPLNSWDFPTYMAVCGLALLIAGWHSLRRIEREVTPNQVGDQNRAPVLFRIVIMGAGLVILAYLFYLPFYRSFQSFYSGLDPTPERSEPIRYLAIHGLFLFVSVTFVAQTLWKSGQNAWPGRIIKAVIRHWEHAPRFLFLWRRMPHRTSPRVILSLNMLVGIAAVVIILWLVGLQSIAMLLVILVPTLLAFFVSDESRSQRLALGLVALGICLGLFCEIFAIKGDIGRMNTVFKFYLQVWVLWALVTGFVLPGVWEQISSWKTTLYRNSWRATLSILIFASMLYPLIGIRARVLDKFDNALGYSLDGVAYAEHAVYRDQGQNISLADDMAAIHWMQLNVDGSPVILEASVPTYRWGSRFSVYTGLPTVLGWDWHQKQQRWGYQWMVDERLEDVRQMYAEPAADRVLPLFKKYQIRYIIVGDMERAYYPAAGLVKFDQMVGKHLDLVYTQGSVKIYLVRQG